MTEDLEQLLRVQARDTAIAVLRHRRETLAERSRLADCLDEAKALLPRQQRLREQRDAQLHDEQRLESEVEKARVRIATEDARLYSGTVTSPRELQALEAELRLLRQRVAHLEDDELEHMGAREALEAELTPIDARLRELRAGVAVLQDAIAVAERAIDDELAAELRARDEEAAAVPETLLGDYDARRRRNQGHGAARLVGDTCQACRLTIPATEVDQIRHDESERLWYCDNCGAILVAS